MAPRMAQAPASGQVTLGQGHLPRAAVLGGCSSPGHLSGAAAGAGLVGGEDLGLFSPHSVACVLRPCWGLLLSPTLGHEFSVSRCGCAPRGQSSTLGINYAHGARRFPPQLASLARAPWVASIGAGATAVLGRAGVSTWLWECKPARLARGGPLCCGVGEPLRRTRWGQSLGHRSLGWGPSRLCQAVSCGRRGGWGSLLADPRAVLSAEHRAQRVNILPS